MDYSKVRYGLLSTAEIARKNWKGIQLTGNSVVVAVASRDLERSRRFISQCQAEAPMEALPKALGSYEELLDSAEVEAVYIPLPTGLRKEWVLRAAEAGKHVVCEKPCACSVSDLQEMLDACRRHKVQFMDGVMFVHSARLQRLGQTLRDGESFGEIRRIDSAFSFRGSPEFFSGNIRANSTLEPFGCLGDLGWYCIRFALWAMDWQMPLQVRGTLLSQHRHLASAAAVPTEFSGELLFQSGVSAGFYCSFLTELQQWALVAGTRGYAHVPDFVLPFDAKQLSFEVRQSAFNIKGCDFRMETAPRLIAVPESSHGDVTAQETNCFRNFADQIRSGPLDDDWPEAALKTQAVMCACLDSARKDGQRTQPVLTPLRAPDSLGKT